MSDKIINLNDHLTKQYGQQSFMLCACQEECDDGLGMFPLVIHDANGPLITGLLCPACENEITLINGRPQ